MTEKGNRRFRVVVAACFQGGECGHQSMKMKKSLAEGSIQKVPRAYFFFLPFFSFFLSLSLSSLSFFLSLVLGLELRALWLLGRHFTSAPFYYSYFSDRLPFLLGPASDCGPATNASQVAGITDITTPPGLFVGMESRYVSASTGLLLRSPPPR
jgi:hypothetical protein